MDSFQAFLEKNKFKYNVITNQPKKTDKNIKEYNKKKYNNECKKFEEEFYKCYDKYIFCDIKK